MALIAYVGKIDIHADNVWWMLYLDSQAYCLFLISLQFCDYNFTQSNSPSFLIHGNFHGSPSPVPDMSLTVLKEVQKKTDLTELPAEQTSIQKLLLTFCRLAQTVNTWMIKD